MNFFYDQGSSKGTRPFSSSSPSSSSSSSQKVLLPFSYQQHQRSWLSSSSSNNGEGTMMDTAPPTSNHCDGDPTYSESQLDLGVGATSTAANPPVAAQLIEKEHMFDKVVTPSDVGKLNRLVIPKQHAEKYFPLDSSTNEKGLLLNFEDRNGKPWRFRYSYWNSSQSYVMTKGWSRFVKEKKLDAGDIVSFQRGVGELGKDRLFIDWRRRPDAPIDHLHPHFTHIPLTSHHFSNFHRSNMNTSVQYPAAAWSHPYLLQPQPPDNSRLQQSYPSHSYVSTYGSVGNSPNYYYHTNSFNDMSSSRTTTVVNGNPCPTVYLRSGSVAQIPQVLQMHRGSSGVGGSGRPMAFDSVPVVQGKAAAKRLRLFGVNMDCPISDSDEICDILSSNPAATSATYAHAPQFLSSSPNNSLQFRTFNDANPLQTAETDEESSDKGKTSISLDLDI